MQMRRPKKRNSERRAKPQAISKARQGACAAAALSEAAAATVTTGFALRRLADLE